jgi:hypothetical protein
MATTTSLRSRRSEGQRHALADVEREIRFRDPTGRRKYLEDFSQAFCSYDSVLDSAELKRQVESADTLLIGDYHALPAAQRFAATLLEARAHPGDRAVVLGVETIFARDQHILEEWWRREIGDQELRQRIRFDLDWGYDWAPFHELLVTAREHAEGIYGLDCMPREDLRKIGARDRHAFHKISEIRQLHPQAVILVLFGESHLAPGHLPKLLRQRMPQERTLTVLQNVDALYWRAAGERHEHVHAVGVADDVVCVFNSTPLEKYESYRLHLSRWGRGEKAGPDLAPTIYNLIDSLLRFLNINRYCSHNRTQPKFLVDLLPEVCCGGSDEGWQRLLTREAAGEQEQKAYMRRLEERGSAYLPRVNAFYVREFQMMYAAEEAARFLHHACRGQTPETNGRAEETADRSYVRVLEQALAFFGSRVLYPARPAVRDEREMSWSACEDLMQAAVSGDASTFEAVAQELGYRIGSSLYDRYLEGSLTRSRLRNLFLARLDEPGRARELCRQLVGRGRHRRKPPRPAGPATSGQERQTTA